MRNSNISQHLLLPPVRREFPISRWTCRIAVVAVLAVSLLKADDEIAFMEQFDQHINPLLRTYCIRCHGGDEPEADIRLDKTDRLSSLADSRPTWLKVQEMLRQQLMPPEEAKQLEPNQRERLLSWLDAAIAAVDCQTQVIPGRVTIRRLNQSEYVNTIRDLLGVDLKGEVEFPADNVGNGFDNMADVLSLSAVLMERYLAVAQEAVTRVMQQKELRDRVVVVRPERGRSREESAERVIRPLATRAFRRPVDDGQIRRLMNLVNQAEAQGANYEESIAFAIQGILVSPSFLFRLEKDAQPDDPEVNRRLDDFELATRLSFFLWSSTPDDELLELAARRKLSDSSVLMAQVGRMLRDEKAMALVDNFAAQWLKLRMLPALAPDQQMFPDFNERLRQAMLHETESFFRRIVTEDRSVLEFLDADYTYLNERLAKHYGIPGIKGKEFQLVSLSDNRRGGLLGHASILTLTSNPTRTSPVKRGLWILENLLGTPPPPPPPDVPELAEGDDVELLGTLRQRMQQHREDTSCAVCHRQMDALGFGFENFDAIGAWREMDGRHSVDPSGELPGGLQFQGPSELRKILKSEKKQDFIRCLAEKMLTYALGRGVESYDHCALQEIVKQVQSNDYRFSALVSGIVQSVPFRMRGSTGQ